MLNDLGVTLFPIATLHPEHAARSLLVDLVDYSVRSSIILLVAWVVAGLLWRRAAATRHAVWAVAITMVAVLPLLSHVTPSITVSLPAVAPIARVTAEAGFPNVRTSPPPAAVQPARSHSPGERAAIPGSPGIPASVGAHQGRAAINLPLAVAVVWVAGALCLVLRFVVGTVLVWRRALVAAPVADADWVMLARDVARQLRIRRPVTLLMTRRPTVPVTWGVIYPVVLLPDDAADWSHARRRIVLLHELAHVARFDAATHLVGQLVLAANWFNPLAWVATARMRSEREGACDDVVLGNGTRATTYAEDLLTLVRALKPSLATGFAALAMARHGELESRVRFILDVRRRRAVSSARASVVSLAAAAPFVMLLAAVQPSARAAPSRAGDSPTAEIVTHMSALVQSVTQSRLPSPRLTVTALPAPRLIFALHPPHTPSLSQPIFHSSSYRCPVEANFVHGGVSADDGKPGALEAEHDDHRVLVLADDGRCVSGWIDGQVVLSPDASDVTGLGTGAQVVVVDAKDGHNRRAEVAIEGTNASKPGYYAFGEPLYVIDGVLVGGAAADAETSKLWVLQQNYIDQTLAASGATSGASGATRRRLEFRYFVDGQPRLWEDGRDWFHTTLAQLVRETGYDVRGRVAQLRLRGGVPAVLDEIRRVQSEMGERAYFDALIDIGSAGDKVVSARDQGAYYPLSAADAKQAIDLAQSILPPSRDRDRIVADLQASTNRSDPSYYYKSQVEKEPPAPANPKP